jgi:hypothetical protein
MTAHRDESNRKGRRALQVLAFALLASVGRPAAAEDDEAIGATYGRVRYLAGALTIEQVAEGEVVEGTVNSPVIAGDRLVMRSGRVEIELADSSVVWMDSDTRLEFRTLADLRNRYERTNLLALVQGSIRVETRDPGDPDAVFQIDTEAGSVYLLSAGSFRIDVAGGSAAVSSYGGVAEFSGDGGSVLVRSGQRSSVEVGRSPSNPRHFNTQRLDEFDRFCLERADAYLRKGEDSAYGHELPEEVRPYASELSFYGTWHTLPTYGLVWRPHYAGVWSPYHHGYWTWCRRGWVWVSYDPWGWAPYHYGRWDFAGDLGWFWVPGTVWNGAWVSFAVGPSYIGWCPLNYWNVPVFHDVWIVERTTVNVTRLDPRGWQFVPTGRFGLRGSDTVVIRGDRLPRGGDFVVTQRLPQFDPRVISRRPERASALVDAARRARVAPPVVRETGGALGSFRTVESRAPRRAVGRPAVERPRLSPPPASSTPPRTPSTSRPSPRGETRQGTGGRGARTTGPGGASGSGQPEASKSEPPRDPDRARGGAMERLFEGSRPKHPARTASPPPEGAAPPSGRSRAPADPEPRGASGPPETRKTPPRRAPEKKPAAPEPPPREDTPEHQSKSN